VSVTDNTNAQIEEKVALRDQAVRTAISVQGLQ
jgi:hypothetical protein